MSATQIKTCSQCPFARLIEDDRYVCTVSETGSDTVRGHWEVTRASCHEAIAQLTTSDTLKALPAEAPSPTQELSRTPKHPFAYDWSVFNGQHSFSSSMYGKCECYDCKPPAAPSPEENPHTTPEQFPLDPIAKTPFTKRRVAATFPEVQAIAKVPDHFRDEIERAGSIRPDTLLAFMRVWGATSTDSKEIIRVINWLIGAPGFDMSNTILITELLAMYVTTPLNPYNAFYFGVDLKEEIDPEPENYHDRY